ncbi:three-helix bundle dimerization domain-containing protein [Streptomyces sp. NPDC001820]|uniref:three-helix bundle dimerization domain-containing protein n=1 Tax=Streptomyces sp. NPDC001820 TaxID=3364613 RepID=UPI00369B1DFF
MTVEEQIPQVGACLSVEGLSRRPGPVERADPAGPPNLPSPGSHDELVSIRNMVARLRAAYPSVDAVTVEATVRTAYGSFHQARVRAYVPILVERRSRRVLGAACRTAPGQAIDGRAAVSGPEPEAARAGGGRPMDAPTARKP